MTKKVLLLTEQFDIQKIDEEGQKFDSVSRLQLAARDSEISLILDINIDIYPVKPEEVFTISFATTLMEHQETDKYDTVVARDIPRESTLYSQYEYIMHGKIYKFKDISKERRKLGQVYMSYGGLQAVLTASLERLQEFEVDDNVYLLLRKVA